MIAAMNENDVVTQILSWMSVVFVIVCIAVVLAKTVRDLWKDDDES